MRLLPLLTVAIFAAFILNEFHASAAPPPKEYWASVRSKATSPHGGQFRPLDPTGRLHLQRLQ